MSYFTATITWSDGMQVTSGRLNEIVSGLRLASDSVDGSTITLSGGVVSVGTVAAANIGANAVTTAKIADGNVNAAKLAADSVETDKIKALNVTGAKIAEETIPFTKTLPADRATQADIQSGTASHFVSPDVLKYIPGAAKAYGRVSFVNGVTTVTGGFNVSGASDTGGARQITLASAMANTSYSVAALSTDGVAPTYEINSATQFTLTYPEGAGREVGFVVFGQLA